MFRRFHLRLFRFDPYGIKNQRKNLRSEDLLPISGDAPLPRFAVKKILTIVTLGCICPLQELL